MIKHDWLMAQVEDLGTCIAAALGFRNQHQYAESISELDTAGLRILGCEPRLIRQLPMDAVLHLLSPGGELDAGTAFMASRLLAEEAQILSLQGGSPTASWDRAARLLALALDDGLDLPDTHALARTILDASPTASAPTRFTLSQAADRLEAAEDALFAWLTEDPEAARTAGRAFYAALDAMDDDALSAGGLPRDELATGRRDLLEPPQ